MDTPSGPWGIYTCTSYSGHVVVFSQQRSLTLQSSIYTFHLTRLLMPKNLWVQPEMYDAWTVWLGHMCSVNTSFLLIQVSFEFWPRWMIPHLWIYVHMGSIVPYTVPDAILYICLEFIHLHLEYMFLLHLTAIRSSVMLVNPMCEGDPFNFATQ